MNQSGERRTSVRCPICQGPAVETSKDNESYTRCRNSSCRQNHISIKCERCESQTLTATISKDGIWNYHCSDCDNKWAAT